MSAPIPTQNETILISYLKQLTTVRSRTSYLLKYPQYLTAFDLHLENLPLVTSHVLELIQRDYATLADIPPHSRWRHFEAVPPAALNPSTANTSTGFPSTSYAKQRIQHLLSETWKEVDQLEKVVRLLDLFVVSVLLDAGAGDKWTYKSIVEGGAIYNRSEGLGIASLEWFLSGGFSSDSDATNPHQCDSAGLKAVTEASLCIALQVDPESNPLVGANGRAQLLQRLGAVCEKFPQYFYDKQKNTYRPGNLIMFLISKANASSTSSFTISPSYEIPIEALWEVVMEGFSGVWPASRTRVGGVSVGDVWPCDAFRLIYKNEIIDSHKDDILPVPGGESLVAFHKLSQWLTYSLMEPLSLYGISFTGVDNMTGLAEYRNGGVFVDHGVICLKKSLLDTFTTGSIPQFNVFDQAVVEWRALTVALLDLVASQVREQLGLDAKQLPLAKILEAGTWKAGREIAAKKRPDSKGPPIQIISDGTVF